MPRGSFRYPLSLKILNIKFLQIVKDLVVISKYTTQDQPADFK